MTKYKLRKNTITYKGQMYNPGDIIEFDTFDNRLPRGWFDEVHEVKRLHKSKSTKKEDDLNGNNDINANKIDATEKY